MISKEDDIEFEFDEKLKARSLELIDASQAIQFGEGLRLGSALINLNAREYARIKRKYGKDHPRTKEMALRVEANDIARKVLFSRYVSASTPQADAGDGWAVDGFVRTADGEAVPGVTVAAYDRESGWIQELGYACTNEKGYFSIAVKKLPDQRHAVYMRASKGRKLLPSNEVQLTPAPKTSDRVEILLRDAGGQTDCAPPSGAPDKIRPPDAPTSRDRPTTSSKKGKESGSVKPAAAATHKTAPIHRETPKWAEAATKPEAETKPKIPKKEDRKKGPE